LANTIVDLSTVPQEYVPYPADGDDDEIFMVSATSNKSKCDNCTVHSGFWTSWKNSRSTILPAVLRAKQENPDYQVVLVGHSLGGAVAALAGLELSLRGLDPQVTTFGEPKIGNGEFSEFINAAFRLDLSTSSDRYRRVTHVNDPVPLLPLKEWGYASHAGEIYISKLSLPPSITDLEVCEGNEDERCIAGAETADSLEHMTTQTSSPMIQVQQHANEMQMQLSLIPAKYRLWELFFSHRDYFWRIGLCVPGGDPGSWRW
jgi:triacylglycerol lipase